MNVKTFDFKFGTAGLHSIPVSIGAEVEMQDNKDELILLFVVNIYDLDHKNDIKRMIFHGLFELYILQNRCIELCK